LPAFAVFSLPDSFDCESLLHGPQGSVRASEALVIATAVAPSPPFAEAEPPFALALPLVTEPPVADDPSDGLPQGSQAVFLGSCPPSDTAFPLSSTAFPLFANPPSPPLAVPPLPAFAKLL
jgi:hypothetical protein